MRKGGGPKQGPRHQNTFEFKHNPKSKKTKMIMGIGNATFGLCPRCTAKIEWRRKYGVVLRQISGSQIAYALVAFSRVDRSRLRTVDVSCWSCSPDTGSTSP